MNKIYGNNDTIKRAQEAPAGSKNVFINWEALEELPDEFEAIVTEVKYDPKNLDASFSDVGKGNWMPQPQMMYEIAEACGISGNENNESAPLIEEIDINPMLCKPMEDEPTIRKKIVGRSVTKQSGVRQEDGTTLISSPCNCEYNAWERCLELWTKEESYTDGYKKTGKYPNKYDTKYKRQLHFQSELKFAHAKAESKSYLKTIRELAKLVTGYKTEELKSGSLIFARIRRSREMLKLETSARLSAISQGTQAEPVKLLFNNAPEPTEEQQPTEPIDVTPDPFDEDIPTEPKKSNREIFIETMQIYFDNDLIPAGLSEVAAKSLTWAKANEDAEKRSLWTSAINKLKAIEADIPDEGKINHELY